MMGLLKAESGSIEIDGIDIKSWGCATIAIALAA